MVTGKEGQVARCLADRALDHPSFDLVFAARQGGGVLLDLCDHETICHAVSTLKPDVIINAAAYTDVDKAEDEPDLAMQINGIAPGILAEEAQKTGARIIHISTDYVFDGFLHRAYVENDPVNPIGVYGKTKLAGEKAVRAATENHAIMRTAWVYSPYGKNFHKTMLRLAQKQDTLTVVDDQQGNPTSAHELADALLTICTHWQEGAGAGLGKTFHFAGREEMTWCGFARKIMAESVARGGPSAKVEAITSADFQTRAIRPQNSRLNRQAFEKTFQ